MADRVAVRVLRALHIGGEPVAAGATLKLDALDAAAVVASGRGVLVNEADAPKLREAVEADTLRALRLERRHVATTPSDPRWQRVA